VESLYHAILMLSIYLLLEVTIARECCLTTKALGIDYTNKLHLIKLSYTHCMYEFILFRKYRNYNMQQLLYIL
jgi:hypothetical protein